jgi:predicted GIY-YIG superfamily endonuclease
MNCGIYKILNKITNKFYIGSSNNLKKRWMQL